MTPKLENGMPIGRKHKLCLRLGVRDNIKVTDNQVIITYNSKTTVNQVKAMFSRGAATALRQEAEAYLPHRLYQLALRFGFQIDVKKIRINHAKTRWGSRSSNGTISLNLMLMIMPTELSDYVLLHELNHIKHMDHSSAFWADLERICPQAKRKRDALKAYTPYL